MRENGRKALLIACLLPFFISSAHAERTEGFRLGVGGGVFQMRAKAPNDSSTYKAFIPGYVARLGYAFSPSWELGVMVSGGGKRTDTQGARTVRLEMPVLPQAYILGRHYLSDSFGMYGLLTAGSLKQESLNAANQVINSSRTVALGAGAGLFWDLTDRYSIDLGGFMPGIRLTNASSALKTYTPGLLLTLNYAFGGSDTRGGAPAVRRQVLEPVVEVREKASSPESVKEIEAEPMPEPVIEKSASEPVKEIEPEPLQVRDIHLEGIIFEPYSAELSQEAQLVLDRAIEQLNELPDVQVEVAAHSDTSGNRDENLQLSHMRAKSVRYYLITHGINTSQVTAKGYGDTQPLYDNATIEGRAKNRRVELRLVE